MKPPGGASRRGDQRWAAYVIGVFLVLAHERGLRLTSGVRVVIASRVPEAKGVSSSAAVETAVMQAAACAFNLTVSPRDVALLCQQAENLVAGAPCGVMDQMTCVFGEPDALMALLCQPAELQAPVPLGDLSVWGIDSGERHAVSGSDYGAVRAGAFMGLRILADHLRVPGEIPRESRRRRNSSASPRHLPAEMSGEEFLARYDGTSDTVTTVVPAARYASAPQRPIRSTSGHGRRRFASCCANRATKSRACGWAR